MKDIPSVNHPFRPNNANLKYYYLMDFFRKNGYKLIVKIVKKFPWIYSRIVVFNTVRSGRLLASDHGLNLSVRGNRILISDKKNKSRIVISWLHRIYLGDMINSFQYYHNSVESKNSKSFKEVDFSQPKFHRVIGFDEFPIFFPSLAEPISTTDQYISFAQLNPGDTVIDLGAYSGLTSILFKKAVGKSGRVIAVEADSKNLQALKINLSNYEKHSSEEITVLNVAVWRHNLGINFSNEGNMGSSAAEFVGERGSGSSRVETMTLTNIAEKFGLESVEFIKCDIEGAESVIFEDAEFLLKYRPRIIVEAHPVNGQLSDEKVISDLAKCGYSSHVIVQQGVMFPLIESSPPLI